MLWTALCRPTQINIAFVVVDCARVHLSNATNYCRRHFANRNYFGCQCNTTCTMLNFCQRNWFARVAEHLLPEYGIGQRPTRICDILRTFVISARQIGFYCVRWLERLRRRRRRITAKSAIRVNMKDRNAINSKTSQFSFNAHPMRILRDISCRKIN